jgi:hypothetical protein
MGDIGEGNMIDLALIIGIVLFSVTCWGFLALCEQLMKS